MFYDDGMAIVCGNDSTVIDRTKTLDNGSPTVYDADKARRIWAIFRKNHMTNLLFLMTDHQRADSVGMVQAGVEVCPNINRLAAGGTQFVRAYSTCPLCVPARTALATGRYPTANGVVINDWKGRQAGNHLTIHQALFDAGYDVAHIGIHHVRVQPDLHAKVPFSSWVGNEEYDAYLKHQGITDDHDPESFKRLVYENQGGDRIAARYSNTAVARWSGDAEDFKDLYWCRQAVSFIEQERDRPFALFLYLWASHPPLRLPQLYFSRFDPAQIDLPDNVGQPAQDEPPAYRHGMAAQIADGVTEDKWRKVWSAHLGLVNLADTGLGLVLDAVEHTSQTGQTLTFFLADHGDHLGQHSMYQKMEMYEQALRVPLIVAGPGIQDQRINTPVSHLDVMPTILDLLDINKPDGLDGRSVARTLRNGDALPIQPIYAQYSGNPAIGDLRRCVVDDRVKYVWSSSGDRRRYDEELYDLKADPLEMTNLAQSASHKETVIRLRRLCQTWGRAHDDWVDI